MIVPEQPARRDGVAPAPPVHVRGFFRRAVEKAAVAAGAPKPARPPANDRSWARR
jgi:hypothetical protein